MTDLPLTGRCLCGGVRFEIDAPLLGALYCHCRRCQLRTGTASSVNGVVAPDSLRIVQGEELIAAYEPPTGSAKLFCRSCGGALLSRLDGDPPRYGVRFGVLDQDPGIRPFVRQWVDSAASWEPIPDDGLPRYGETAPLEAVRGER
jgi:hypothetical protein